MTRWWTADPHFGHYKIMELCQRHRHMAELRGRAIVTADDMNEVLISKWNQVVKPEDTVIVVGDFAFKKPDQFLELLHGNIILVRGNHDGSDVRKRMPMWCEWMDARIGGFRCRINHRPLYPEGSDDPYQDSDDSINPDAYDFVISGHIHDLRMWSGMSLNVGVDVHNFEPISEEHLVHLLQTRHRELPKNRRKLEPVMGRLKKGGKEDVRREANP